MFSGSFLTAEVEIDQCERREWAGRDFRRGRWEELEVDAREEERERQYIVSVDVLNAAGETPSSDCASLSDTVERAKKLVLLFLRRIEWHVL